MLEMSPVGLSIEMYFRGGEGLSENPRPGVNFNISVIDNVMGSYYSCTGPRHIHGTWIFSSPMSTDVLAPNGAKPSVDTVLTTMLHVFVRSFFAYRWFRFIVFSRWDNLNQSRSREISLGSCVNTWHFALTGQRMCTYATAIEDGFGLCKMRLRFLFPNPDHTEG